MKRIQLVFVICAGLTLLALLCCAFFIKLSGGENKYSDPELYLSGWTDKNGDSVSLYRVFANDTTENTFSRYIDGSTLNGRELCLVTHNISFRVTLDGEELYKFYPRLGGIYGKRYGEALHTTRKLPSVLLTAECMSARER